MANQIHIEQEDHQPLPSSNDLVLNLSLSVNNNDEIPCHGSSSNLNSDKRYHGDAHTNVDHDQGHQNHDQHQHNPRVFSCNYCQRKFYSSQALGGHQNAHKRERTLAKRHRIVGDVGLGRSSSMASLPLHGYRTFNRNSLGIQVHSMIHKPTSSYVSSSIGKESGSGYGYGYSHHGDGSKSGVSGHEGWHRLPLHQQPNVGKIGGQGSAGGLANGNSVPGVAHSEIVIARYQGVRKFSPATDGISGGLWQGVGVGSQLKRKPEELQNIDLSLKL